MNNGLIIIVILHKTSRPGTSDNASIYIYIYIERLKALLVMVVTQLIVFKT